MTWGTMTTPATMTPGTTTRATTMVPSSPATAAAISEENRALVAGRFLLPANAQGSLRVRYRGVGTGASEQGCLRLAVPLVTLDGLRLTSTPDLFQASLRLERSYERYETFPTEHALVPSGLDWTLPIPPSHLRVVGCDGRRSMFVSVWLDRLAVLVLAVAALAAVTRLRRS